MWSSSIDTQDRFLQGKWSENDWRWLAGGLYFQILVSPHSKRINKTEGVMWCVQSAKYTAYEEIKFSSFLSILQGGYYLFHIAHRFSNKFQTLHSVHFSAKNFTIFQLMVRKWQAHVLNLNTFCPFDPATLS